VVSDRRFLGELLGRSILKRRFLKGEGLSNKAVLYAPGRFSKAVENGRYNSRINLHPAQAGWPVLKT